VFVRALFGKRRKSLRTTLAEAAAAVSRPMPQVDAETLQRRAETLSPTELVGLLRLTLQG
jgi:16S rRNA A1518/A1519 N6-dimethyltransferase RsmA/KsgA/DIM1 with predicted DNA glycosylase/AP lyase activity